MRRLIAIILILLLPASALAEDGTLFTFVEKNQIRLRWNAPLQQPYQGFHVERKQQGGDWQRITTKPVKRITDVKQIRKLLGPSAESFLTFFDIGTRQITNSQFDKVMSDGVARSMIQLLSVKIPDFGRVLGEFYSDTDLAPGKSFDYRIILIARDGSESTWAQTSKPVVHGKVETVPVPQDLTGKAGEETALLNWKHDEELSRQGRLIGYWVYRAEKPFGPFVSASADMIIPTKVNGEYPDDLFADRFLINGTTYWYHITGVNVVGVESKPGDTIKVTPKDQTPPSPPDTLNGRILGEHVLLEWSPVKADDLKSYRIYRAEEANGPFEMIDESSTESYLDTTVEEGDIFWYYVTALDESDNESRESPIVQVFREDKTPPAAPQQLEAVGTDDGIELKWAANGEKDLRGYLVERTTRIKGRGDKAVAEGPFFKEHVDPLTEPHYLDPVPKKSQSRYAYRIIALDNAWNESLPSEAVIARMPDHTPPGKPVLTDAVLDKGVVTLHWQPSIEEDLAGFRVYRARLGGGKETAKFTPLSEKLAAPDVIQFEDRPKGVGETFGYYITALDESDNESEPSDMMQVLVLDDVPPPAPINVQQQVTEQGIELSWELKQADDIARITVYRSLKGKDDFIIIADFDTKTQSFIDTQVTEGKEYTYRLTTMDSVDNESEPAEITVLFQPQQEQNGGNEKKQ